MPHIDGEIVIDRPVEDVFDYVADQRNEVKYNPNMVRSELLREGPIGKGSTFRAAIKGMGGRTLEMQVELTDFVRPHRIASRTHTAGLGDTEGSLTFEPMDGATRMKWSWDLKLHGVGKLATPIAGWLGRRQEEATWNGCKRQLEGGSADPASPTGK